MDLNKTEYRQFCKEKKNQIPLFFQPYWLDAVGGEQGWDVVIHKSQNKILGVLPFGLSKKLLLHKIANPILSPRLGVYFVYPENQEKEERRISFEHRVSKELIAKLPSHFYFNLTFHIGFKNWMSFYWEGFKQTTKYTFVIPASVTKDQAYKNIKSKTKNIIRKAEPSLQISKCSLDIFWDLNQKTFARQSLKVPYTKEIINSIQDALSPRNQISIYQAMDADHKVHASILLVHDNRTTYCLAIGSDEAYRNSGAIPLLLWNAIKKSIDDGRSFDFEGSMMPNVEPVFRNFGGSQTAYFQIYKSANRFTDALLTLIGKW